MTTILHRRGTAAEWYDANPVLEESEIGYVALDPEPGADNTDAGKFKIGDGITYWNSLDFSSGGTTVATPNYLAAFSNNDVIISGIENATIIDSITAAEWRNVEYNISISKTTSGANYFYSTQLSILIDKTGETVTEYNTINNNGDMGTISVSRNGANVELTVTPGLLIKPVTVRFSRTGLKA
jgi:hypothetical protein